MKHYGRRKKLIVDKMQLKLLAINMVYSAATVLIFLAIVFGPPILTTFDSSASPEAKLQAADRMLMLHASTWPALIALGLLFGFHSILYTHRIAGPLVGFRRVLHAVGEGDLTVRASVRARDYLKADSEVINQMIDQTIDRARAVRNVGNDLHGSAVELERLRSASNCGELDRAVRTLEAQVAVLHGIGESYQLPDAEGPANSGTEFPAMRSSAERDLVDP